MLEPSYKALFMAKSEAEEEIEYLEPLLRAYYEYTNGIKFDTKELIRDDKFYNNNN
jgi:hypothetical protein